MEESWRNKETADVEKLFEILSVSLPVVSIFARGAKAWLAHILTIDAS